MRLGENLRMCESERQKTWLCRTVSENRAYFCVCICVTEEERGLECGSSGFQRGDLGV